MAMIDPSVRPVKIDRPEDATGLVDPGKLVELLDQQDAAAVMRAIEEVSELKLERMTEADIVEQLIRCGLQESTHLVAAFGNPQLLDPRSDLDIVGDAASIFSAAELDQSKLRKTAAVMKLVVNGLAGAGTIEFGGYDYHDGTRATGEVRDFEAGQAMGAALEYAARIGQQLMLYVFSDGSVSSNGQVDASVDGRGKGIWQSDNSNTAAVFVLVYDPTARPLLVAPDRQQIGWFRSSGDVETSATRVSNNVELLAEAIVLNYLALHDEIDQLDQVLPGHGLGTPSEIDSLVALQPIRASS